MENFKKAIKTYSISPLGVIMMIVLAIQAVISYGLFGLVLICIAFPLIMLISFFMNEMNTPQIVKDMRGVKTGSELKAKLDATEDKKDLIYQWNKHNLISAGLFKELIDYVKEGETK